MRFQSDLLLWLLLVVPPALLAFFWWAWRQRERLLGQFIEPRLLAGLTAGVSATRRKWKLGLLLASVVLLIAALARPQWGFHWEESKQRGLDVVIAIDTSKSMLADDISPDRLTRAKLAALDLLQQAKSDRLGLVAFAGSAFLMCPLTIDDGAFRQCVDALDVETIPSGGTALAEAIDTARTAFNEDPDSYKILVLFSDGEDHDDRAVEAAKEAVEAGLRIFTIGIGTSEGEMVRLKDAKGRTDFVRDDDGNVVKSKLNESLLQEVARAGNGFYLPLRGAKTMDTLYEQGLAPLPKSESQARLVKRFHERYHFPLALAIVLLLAEFFLSERRRAARSATARTPGSAGPITATATLVLCLWGAASANASVSSAQRAYQAGRFEDARREYDALLLRRADDLRLQFNAGAAAYRDGQFADAVGRFTKAAAAPDLKLQQHAYYNRGNTHYQIGERESELDKKREAWEEAVKDYEATLKLEAKDGDAQHNLEFVRRKLEELKQQQQQQQQQQNQEQNQQEQKDQQKQQQKDQQQQPQDKQDQQQQDKQQSPDQQKDQQKQQSGQDQKDKEKAQREQQQKEKERQEQQKQEQERQKAEQQKQSQQPKPGDQNKQAGEPQAGEDNAQIQGLLTPQQARQILDAQKSEEKMLPVDIQKQPDKPGSPRRFKDW
jgi:Ca-activated chloride channel family protein